MLRITECPKDYWMSSSYDVSFLSWKVLTYFIREDIVRDKGWAVIGKCENTLVCPRSKYWRFGTLEQNCRHKGHWIPYAYITFKVNWYVFRQCLCTINEVTSTKVCTECNMNASWGTWVANCDEPKQGLTEKWV